MRVTVDTARELCTRVFAGALGAPDHIAQIASDVLLDADLRGIDSHGFRVLPYYLARWRYGQIVPGAEPKVVRESATSALLDAGQAIGHYASQRAAALAVDKAREAGMAAAVVNNSTHNGAISYYALQAARAGMIGIAATACAPHTAPLGGGAGLHGTNPLAYAIPRSGGEPMVFDFSTGYSAAKLRDQGNATGELPADRLVDAQGRPSRDPADLKSGWILPAGGHLGYGLGLLVDTLACALGGAPIGRQMPLVHDHSGPYHGSFFVMALSADGFAGRDAFLGQVEELVRQIETIPPSDPAAPVRWPGQRGVAERAQRRARGLPVTTAQWSELCTALAAEGVDVEGIEPRPDDAN